MDIIVSRRFSLPDENPESHQETLRKIAAALRNELEKSLDFITEEVDENIPDILLLKGCGRVAPGILLWRVSFEVAFEIDSCEQDSTVRIGARVRTRLPGWLPLTLGGLLFLVLGIFVVIYFILVYGGYVFAAHAPAKAIERILEKVQREFSNS